ncbi:MAG: hypothetical protein QM664_10035 [Flavihumibacter sp.]
MQAEMFQGKVVHDERAAAVYRLVILPDGGLATALAAESAYATSRYGSQAKWEERPVLELLRFRARADMEDTLLRWMRRICGQWAVFKLVFNNYGSHPLVPLYLRLADGSTLQSLAASFHLLDGWLKSNGMEAVRLSSMWRLPLVSRLDEEEALPFLLDFSSRALHAVVKVEELVLEKSGGQVVSRLSLAPRPLQIPD